MHILSIFLTTFLSIINVFFLIFSASGSMTAETTAARLPLIIITYLYQLIIPIIFFFFIYNFANSKKERSSKSLSIAFLFPLVQAIVSIILLDLNSTTIASPDTTIGDIMPAIIAEAITIIITFCGTIIFSIKSTNSEKASSREREKAALNYSAPVFAWTAFLVGVFSLSLDIISIIALKSNSSLGFFQATLTAVKHLQILCVPVFTMAILNTITMKSKNAVILSWIGTVALFLTYPVMYSIAYL